ncbi:MAG: ribosome maturation factor RimM [Desulfonatronovibrionaceae bacterium]
MAKDLVHLGKVAKPHGLKGELRVYAAPGSPVLLEGVDRVYLQGSKMNPRPFRLLSLRPSPKGLIFALEGITGRDQAEKWREADVLAREKDVDPGRDDCGLLVLTGYRIYAQDEGYLGELSRAWETGAGVVWSIISEDGSEILFPARPRFIKHIDRRNFCIEIVPPPGLLEIYS